MKLGRESSLIAVAVHVARALGGAGIRAVLTGGACASLHTDGRIKSFDLDFVLQGVVPARRLDEAMAAAGFARKGSQYFRPGVRFVVEFPAGPLGIGTDDRIRPLEQRIRGATLLALSPTDSCRDRLAGFYHWNDRQCLSAAVAIARRHRVDMSLIRRWSVREGFLAAFEEFRTGVERARSTLQRRT